MNSTEDLRSKLNQLAKTDDEFVGGARVISKGGIPTPLQAILTEISETVLTRDLTFNFETSGSIVLVVSGRRLLGVRSIEGLAMPAIINQLAGQQIAGSDDPRLRALVGVLLPLDLLTDTLTTTSTAVEWAGPETGTGVSADRLADKLSVDFPIKDMTRVEHMKSRFGVDVLASVQRLASGEEVVEGEESDLDWLFAQAGSFLGAVRPADQAPKLAILGHNQGSGRTIVGVFDGAESLIWVESRANIASICASWRHIYVS